MDGNRDLILHQALYPLDRPQFWAMHVLRALLNSEAIDTIGEKAFLLVMAVANVEDQIGYTRPITFHNVHLCRQIGIKKVDTLAAARQRAVEAGWLHYDRPPKGTRKPGHYWTKIPLDIQRSFIAGHAERKKNALPER